ncbi:hypothetical protein T02_3712 [Trichinella nativa]|uniref:Uncharacterized protein n=1 Tax=Trichinella nativa TaxID=6335 RepID=A0A0V1KWX3_9BILA|nr:hypothetical protein T02_3712 [Trichinella nativa]
MSVFSLVTLRTGRWLRCVAPAVEVDLSCVNIMEKNNFYQLILIRSQNWLCFYACQVQLGMLRKIFSNENSKDFSSRKFSRLRKENL